MVEHAEAHPLGDPEDMALPLSELAPFVGEWYADRMGDRWVVMREMRGGGQEYVTNSRMAARRFTKREAVKVAAQMNEDR